MGLGTILLLSVLVVLTHTFDFQGGLMTFRPVKIHSNGTITVSFHYKESYRGPCSHQLSWDCASGDCGQVTASYVTDTDKDASGQGLWCQSEGHILRSLPSAGTFTLRDEGCCWVSNLDNAVNWTLATTVDLGRRSDTYNPNKSPVMTTVPTIRMPQNCFTRLPLLSHDPDEDRVRCRFEQADTSLAHPAFTLNETRCTLELNKTASRGVHVFKMVVEDFPTEAITLSYSGGTSSVRNPLNPLSQLPLHFAVEVGSPLSSCVPGVIRPQFLHPTPVHGDVHYAALGQRLTLTLRAQATNTLIYDFQLSGPYNMTKNSFQNYSNGIVQVQVTWTPQENDVLGHFPICFTAEARESQSEMRCIVVIVERNALLSVDADISCSDNLISIALPKAGMLGVDANKLLLKDPTCSLTYNRSHIMASVSLSTCGTQMLDNGDYLVFKNEISSIKETSIITRMNLVKIPFMCSYPKKAFVTASFKNHKSDFVFTETAFGSFSYSFNFYTDNTFQSVIDPSSYPVEVKLLEKIHMGISGHTTLPNVELFVESCKATPDDNPNNPLFYDIIKNGCKLDETLTVSPRTQTEFMFEIQTFKFNGDFDEVFISCDVVMCETDSSHSRCKEGCVSTPISRRKRDLDFQTHRHTITQGPLKLKRHTSAVMDRSGSGEQGWSSSTLLFGGLFITAVLIMVGVMVYYKMKMKPLDRTYLLSSS